MNKKESGFLITVFFLFLCTSCGVKGPPIYKSSPEETEYSYEKDYLSTAKPEKKIRRSLFWVKNKNE